MTGLCTAADDRIYTVFWHDIIYDKYLRAPRRNRSRFDYYSYSNRIIRLMYYAMWSY